MKKFLCAALALVLVLSLAACGGNNNLTEEKLKGTWQLELKVADLLSIAGDQLGDAMGMGDISAAFDNIPKDLAITALYVFDGNGNSSVLLDKESIAEFFESLMDAILTEDFMYGMFEAQGMDKATVDAALAAQGTDMASLIALTKLQMSSMDFTEAMGGEVKGDYIVSNEEIAYTIEDNRVISDSMTMEYDGTNLLITTVESEEEDAPDMTGLLPLTLTRVSDKTDY